MSDKNLKILGRVGLALMALGVCLVGVAEVFGESMSGSKDYSFQLSDWILYGPPLDICDYALLGILSILGALWWGFIWFVYTVREKGRYKEEE